MNIWSVDHRCANDEMRNIIKNIKEDIDLYVLAGLIMKAENQKNDVAGIFNIINDSESLMNLIAVYGGTTVKIPTIEELMDSMKFIKLIYCYDFQYKSFSQAMKLAGFTDNRREELLKRRDDLINTIGGAFNGNSGDG